MNTSEQSSKRPAIVRRVPADEVGTWTDPYSRPMHGVFTDLESNPPRGTAEYDSFIEDFKNAETNLARRVRLECFFCDWKVAIATHKVEKNEVIDTLHEELFTSSTSRRYGKSEDLIDDIEKIQGLVLQHKDSIDNAIQKLQKVNYHPSLTIEELELIISDWTPGIDANNLPPVFKSNDESIGKIKAIEEVSEEVIKLADMFCSPFSPQKSDNSARVDELFSQLLTDVLLDRKIDEPDAKLILKIRRLAEVSVELTDLTVDVFGKPIVKNTNEETLEQNKVQESELAWGSTLAAILVTALGSATQSYLQSKSNIHIDDQVEVQHGQ